MKYLKDSGQLKVRREERVENEFLAMLANELQKAVLGPLKQANKLDQIVQDLASRKTDPYSTVKEVLKEVLK